MYATTEQITQWAYNAGFTGDNLPIAVAVAYAESSGNTSATHHNRNGTVDYGLWQINSSHSGEFNMSNWSDGAANARMAYQVWKMQGWNAWVTYSSGAYMLYMAKASLSTQGFQGNTKYGDHAGAQKWLTSVLKNGYLPKSWRDGTTQHSPDGVYTLKIPKKSQQKELLNQGWIEWKVKPSLGNNGISTGWGPFTFNDEGYVVNGELAYGVDIPSDSNKSVGEILGIPGADAATDIVRGANDVGSAAVGLLFGDWNIKNIALIVVGGIMALLAIIIIAKANLPL